MMRLCPSRFTQCRFYLGAALFLASTYCFAFEMGPLNRYLEPGESNGWTLRDDRGAALFENAATPGDINYYFVNTNADVEGRRTISVQVAVQSQNDGQAGLLYGMFENPRTYFLFTADGKGTATLYYRGPKGFDTVESYPVAQGNVTLAIQERGTGLALFINGEERKVMHSDRFGRGGVGIVTTSIGRFRLSAFQLDIGANAAPQPAAAQPAAPQARAARTPAPEMARATARENCSDGMTMQAFHDPNSGMVRQHSPMPPGWNFVPANPDKLFISGPNTKVFSYEIGAYAWGKTRDMNATMRNQNVRQVAQPVPLEDFLRQQVAPNMQRHGFRLTGSGRLPQLESFWELFSMSMPQLGNVRRYQAVGSEWENNEGSVLYKLMLLTTVESAQAVLWNVHASDVYAPRDRFEFARDSYLCAYAQTKVNPQWQIHMNNKLLAAIRSGKIAADRRAAQSAAAHAQRMNAIAAQGNATRSIGKTYSDILDINHAGYLKRSDMISAGQAKSADYAAGKSVIYSQQTGERFKVDAGNNHYWINNEGKYFGTDNPNLDPRTDQRFSDSVWTQTELIR